MSVALSPRELEVLQLLAKGLQNAEIARVLGTSRHTIRTQLERGVYEKFDVTNRVEAVIEGMRRGYLPLPVVETRTEITGELQIEVKGLTVKAVAS